MAIYMKISGVTGSVTTKGYEGAIEVSELDFAGVKVPMQMMVGKAVNRALSEPHFGQVSIIKNLDKSSNAFFEAAHNGQAFASLEFDYVSTGATPVQYSKIMLTNAMVSHYSEQNVGSATEMPKEVIRFCYTKISRTFVPRDSTGQAGSPLTTGYDIEQATQS